jgi:hypothetical protein
MLYKMFTGGDAGSLYPHLYNIPPSILTQLGSKHSRLGVHLQDQLHVRILCDKRNYSQKPGGFRVWHWIPIQRVLSSIPGHICAQIFLHWPKIKLWECEESRASHFRCRWERMLSCRAHYSHDHCITGYNVICHGWPHCRTVFCIHVKMDRGQKCRTD